MNKTATLVLSTAFVGLLALPAAAAPRGDVAHAPRARAGHHLGTPTRGPVHLSRGHRARAVTTRRPALRPHRRAATVAHQKAHLKRHKRAKKYVPQRKRVHQVRRR